MSKDRYNIKELYKNIQNKINGATSENEAADDIKFDVDAYNITKKLVETIKEQFNLSEDEITILDWAASESPVLIRRVVIEGGMLSEKKEIYMKDRKDAYKKEVQCTATIKTLCENGRSDAPIIKVNIKLPEEGVFNPQAGDVLYICPENNGEVLERLKEIFKDTQENDLKDLITYKTSIDLLRVIQSKVVQKKLTHDKVAMYKLNFLINLHEKDPKLAESILEKTRLLDVLESFPDVVSFADTKDLQGLYNSKDNARPYTISSIERNDSNVPVAVEICVASSTYKVSEYTFGGGKKYDGACVTTLKNLKDQSDAKLKCYVQPRAFGNPVKGATDKVKNLTYGEMEMLKKPIILIGAGTGISGLRTIIQERAFLKERGVEVGPVTLVFGMRDKTIDYLYEDELRRYQEQGVIDRIIEAQSRPKDGNKKQYVQDVLPQLTEQLKDLPEGEVYLAACGDSKMGDQLVDAVVKCITGTSQINSSVSSKYEGQNVDDKGCFLLRTTSGTNHEALLSIEQVDKIKSSLVASVIDPSLLPKGTNIGNLKLLKTLLENRIFPNKTEECKKAMKYLEEGFNSLQPQTIKPTSITKFYNDAVRAITN